MGKVRALSWGNEFLIYHKRLRGGTNFAVGTASPPIDRPRNGAGFVSVRVSSLLRCRCILWPYRAGGPAHSAGRGQFQDLSDGEFLRPRFGAELQLPHRSVDVRLRQFLERTAQSASQKLAAVKKQPADESLKKGQIPNRLALVGDSDHLHDGRLNFGARPENAGRQLPHNRATALALDPDAEAAVILGAGPRRSGRPTPSES